MTKKKQRSNKNKVSSQEVTNLNCFDSNSYNNDNMSVFSSESVIASYHEFDDENYSINSDCNVSDVHSYTTYNVEIETFDKIIDLLYEKRSSTRIYALKNLINVLSSNYCIEEASEREESLTRSLLQSIRKGKGDEISLAARSLSLLIFTLGEDTAINVRNATCKTLLNTAMTNKCDEGRLSALEAYTTGLFVSEGDDDMIFESMLEIQELWEKKIPRLCACAIRCWTLLLSLLPTNYLSFDSFKRASIKLKGFLNDSDLDMQIASGEAIALLYSTASAENRDNSIDLPYNYSTTNIQSFDGRIDDDGTNNSKNGIKGNYNSNKMDMMHEMKNKIKNLSIAKGEMQKKSKKDRAGLKATFRELSDFIEDGNVKEKRIKLRNGDLIVIEDIRKRIQIDYVRKILADGFHRHIHENELIHAMFDYAPRKHMRESLSKEARRYFNSPSSEFKKFRTKERNYERNNKHYRYSEY